MLILSRDCLFAGPPDREEGLRPLMRQSLPLQYVARAQKQTRAPTNNPARPLPPSEAPGHSYGLLHLPFQSQEPLSSLSVLTRCDDYNHAGESREPPPKWRVRQVGY